MDISLMTPFGLPINKIQKTSVSGEGVSLEEFRAYQQEVANALANKTSLYPNKRSADAIFIFSIVDNDRLENGDSKSADKHLSIF